MLQVGQKAPHFTFFDISTGEENKDKELSLDFFKGKTIVLYFYPRDNTPGCTTEACAFRDAYDKILEKKAVVIGISPDKNTSHENFKSKYSLPFYLVPDPDKKIMQDYDVLGEKSMFGKKYIGVLRSTYIIDTDGIISHVFPKVSPSKHINQVLNALA